MSQTTVQLNFISCTYHTVPCGVSLAIVRDEDGHRGSYQNY